MTDNMASSLACDECYAPLAAAEYAPGQPPPCPQCGSIKRHINIELSEQVEIKEFTDMIVKHERVTEWISIKKRPKYPGTYQVKNDNGVESNLTYDAGIWEPYDGAKIVQWRGQFTVLRKADLARLREVMDSYKHDPAHPDKNEKAGAAAVRLARHWAGPTSKRIGIEQMHANFFESRNASVLSWNKQTPII